MNTQRNKLYLKRFFGIAFFLQLIRFAALKAQQEPLYTQYMLNTNSVNPAYAGTRNTMNLLTSMRLQWMGVDRNTYNLSMHTPLNNHNTGVGFSVVDDTYGPVSNLYLNFNYAYRVHLTDKIILSMGLKGCIYSYNYYVGPDAGSSFIAYNYDYLQKEKLNVGAGLFLYSDRWYAGFSVPTMLEPDLDEYNSSSGELSELERHYYLMGGYVFDLNKDWKLMPSAILEAVENSSTSLDIAAQFIYLDSYKLGVSYRSGGIFALLANAKFYKKFTFGYSYVVATSKSMAYNRDCQEIVLSYDFDGLLKKKATTPRYF